MDEHVKMDTYKFKPGFTPKPELELHADACNLTIDIIIPHHSTITRIQCILTNVILVKDTVLIMCHSLKGKSTSHVLALL